MSAKMTCASCTSELLLQVVHMHSCNIILCYQLQIGISSCKGGFKQHWKLSFKSKLASVQWDQHKHGLETL